MGAATLLSSHAGHPRPATSDTTEEVRPNGRQPQRESARRRSRTIPAASDVTNDPNHNSKPLRSSSHGRHPPGATKPTPAPMTAPRRSGASSNHSADFSAGSTKTDVAPVHV